GFVSFFLRPLTADFPRVDGLSVADGSLPGNEDEVARAHRGHVGGSGFWRRRKLQAELCKALFHLTHRRSPSLSNGIPRRSLLPKCFTPKTIPCTLRGTLLQSKGTIQRNLQREDDSACGMSCPDWLSGLPS